MVPSLLTHLRSSFWRARASCCRRDVNCHIERYTPNHSITHIPDIPVLKARVKQRIMLSIDGGFNLSAAEPDCCCLLSLICILPSVLASFPVTPHKLLHFFLSPPPSLSSSHYSYCHCLLTCPCLSQAVTLLSPYPASGITSLTSPCSALHLPTSSCGSARIVSTTAKLSEPSDFIANLSPAQLQGACGSL